MFIDSHCHLDRLDLSRHNNDMSQLLTAAHNRGVQKFLCVAINLEHIADVLAIAENYPNVYASVGVHPSEPKPEHALSIETLVNLANHPKVIALGEMGLDYSYGNDTKELQKERFCIQLQAAKKIEKAVIVHSRDAVEDTLEILKRELCGNSVGVMHCFTESWDMASRALDMGLYISISGIVTFKNAVSLREVVKKIPLDRLLVETDAPYLAPVPYRGKPNEPTYLPEIIAAIADIKKVSVEELGKITTANFNRLFSI